MALHKNEIRTLAFSDISLLGAGVAHADGFAVFCPGVLADEEARVRITDVRKKYAHAELVERLSASPDRIEPECAAFGQCGGCVFGHLRPGAEAHLKENAVRAALRQVAGEAAFDPIVTGAPERYRNKAVFHIAPNGKIGYYAAGTHDVFYPVDGCRLLPESFDGIARFSEEYLRRTAGAPRFCALSLRTSAVGAVTAVLYAGKETAETRRISEAWADALCAAFPCVTGAFAGSGDPASPEARITLLRGDEFLHDTFLGLHLRVSPAAFYQVNHAVAEALCRCVAEFAALRAGETAADLYCGTGVIGMTLAAQTTDASVTGIEINAHAVADARANAGANRLGNIRFHCGDSASAQKTGSRFDCIVIDPPRRGCSSEMLAALRALAPARIVYVSCNPATLARDLAALAPEYRLTRVRAHNMFPRTEHVETVCQLVLRKPAVHSSIDADAEKLAQDERGAAAYE